MPANAYYRPKPTIKPAGLVALMPVDWEFYENNIARSDLVVNTLVVSNKSFAKSMTLTREALKRII
jgi:hypothetical protein